MDKKQLFKNYEAPQVEVIEVEVEKGFATSGEIESLGDEEEWL